MGSEKYLFVDVLNQRIDSSFLISKVPYSRSFGPDPNASDELTKEAFREIKSELRRIIRKEAEPNEWGNDLAAWVSGNLMYTLYIDSDFKMREDLNLPPHLVKPEERVIPEIYFRRFIAEEIRQLCTKRTIWHIGVCKYSDCGKYFVAKRKVKRTFCSDKCRKNHHRSPRKHSQRRSQSNDKSVR